MKRVIYIFFTYLLTIFYFTSFVWADYSNTLFIKYSYTPVLSDANIDSDLVATLNK